MNQTLLRFRPHLVILVLTLVGVISTTSGAAEPLASWKDTPSKQAIIEFVKKTTTEGSSDFVPVPDRIATFDNDGTLWTEHPMYTQLAFALDRVTTLSSQHLEWKTTLPFKAVLDKDLVALAKSGEKGLYQLVMTTHTGLTTAEFESVVSDWFEKSLHPRFKKRYTELVYQPMIELQEYLRANGFKTYIVSGGGIEFMRPMTQAVYGIPPEQVIGSSVKTKFEIRDGKPVLMRLPEIEFVDDKAGKPIAINRFIGKRPLAAFGNSDGDREMLQWTAAGSGPRLMMLVLHNDATREYAYGPANGLPDTKFGAFSESLFQEAKEKGWNVISMKDDWARVFPFEE